MVDYRPELKSNMIFPFFKNKQKEKKNTASDSGYRSLVDDFVVVWEESFAAECE